MAVYQLKLKFEDRHAVTFLEPEEVATMSFSSLVEKIQRSLPSRYHHLSVEELRIQYLDDEKCFVYLSRDYWVEMFRCASPVENADFKRITLKVDLTNSPTVTMPSPMSRRGKRSSTSTNPSPSSLPSRNEKETRKSIEQRPKASRRLTASFTNQAVLTPQVQPQAPSRNLSSLNLFKSPLEKFIDHQQEKLNAHKEKEHQLSGWIREYRNLKPGPKCSDGPMCGNCHRREKHNRLNCPYQECKTFFHCGELSKHSEEKATVKDLQKQHKDVLKEISSLENELKLKQQSIASIQDRYIYKVKKSLIESDPSKYLTAGADGNLIENWFILNKDAKKLEHVCKGRVPATDEIRGILSGPDLSINSSVSEREQTRVRNPYRKLWEDRGVQWPCTSTSAANCAVPSFASPGEYQSGLQSTVQKSPEMSDDYLLALGIQESLKTAVDPIDTYDTQSMKAQDDISASTSDATSDQTTEAKANLETSDGHFSGLNVLLEACRELQDD